MQVNLCQLDSLGLSCFGCCGHSYTVRKEIEEGILKNTFEYEDYMADVRFKGRALDEFMNRSKSLRVCGICKNIIFLGEDKVGCPCHPEQTNISFGHKKSDKISTNLSEGFDMRTNHCDINYKCKAKKLFDTWNTSKQKKFLDFLKGKKKKGMDWYGYSIKMDDDSLLKEFMKANI